MRFVAVDPGDVHVGWAVFTDDNRGTRDWGAWRCESAEEITPLDLLNRIISWSNPPRPEFNFAVVEEFRPYPTTIKALIGSDLPTARMIGWIELACHTSGVVLHKQPAHILKATEEMTKRKLITLMSRGHGGHAKDAELHGWYRVLQGER